MSVGSFGASASACAAGCGSLADRSSTPPRIVCIIAPIAERLPLHAPAFFLGAGFIIESRVPSAAPAAAAAAASEGVPRAEGVFLADAVSGGGRGGGGGEATGPFGAAARGGGGGGARGCLASACLA